MSTQNGGIMTIDGYYVLPKRAAVYLLEDGAEAAFVDTATRFSAPLLIKALERTGLGPEQVRYIVVTHVHLDHSGGTAELAKLCPNATVLAHPRAARHLVDPSKLVEAARPIYGDRFFEQVFGEIDPIPPGRVVEVADGETRPLGNRTLTFLHTPGHARHHMSVLDTGANAVIAGDAFGLAHVALQHGTAPYLGYVCSPPDFNPAEAKASIERILQTGVNSVYVTHYGNVTALQPAAEQLFRTIDQYAALVDHAAGTSLDGRELVSYCEDSAAAIIERELQQSGLDPNDDEVNFWAMAELSITAQGIAYMARRRGEGAASSNV